MLASAAHVLKLEWLGTDIYTLWVCVCVCVCSVMSDSLWSHGLYNLLGSFVHGISQVRILECVSHCLLQGVFLTQRLNLHLLLGRQILYYEHYQRSPSTHWGRAMSLPSCLTLCDPGTVDLQAPLSMGFSRQEYWSGLLCPPPGDLPNPGMEPSVRRSPPSAGGFFTASAPWETLIHTVGYIK